MTPIAFDNYVTYRCSFFHDDFTELFVVILMTVVEFTGPEINLSSNYEDHYNESINNPEKYWGKIAELLSWSKPWTKVLDCSEELFTKWYIGGELNACYNALDRHVESGKGSKTAIIYESPLTGTSRKITYAELQKTVAKLAGALAGLGVKKGDVVIIYMPAIPEAIIAILAIVRLGAIHSIVFGGFAARELCNRIQHCKPKTIIAADCGIEPNKIIKYFDNLNQAIMLSHYKPSKCIIYQRKIITVSNLDPEKYIDWDQAIQDAAHHDCVPIESNETLYILYTSGTTGDPKAVQRPIGGHLVNLIWSMKVIYGLKPDDIWWSTSDLGWVVGHSYICYAPLLYGSTTVLYEGKPTVPNPAQYFKIISDYKVNVMFSVPTILRLMKKEDPEGIFTKSYDISSLRHLFVAGEHCDLNTKLWAQKIFRVPVINHWWQTETGHAITTLCVGLSHKIETNDLSTGLPYLGFKIEILRENGTKANHNELGRIVIQLPLPPGVFSSLYKADDKFISYYFTKFPGYYDTMDAGYIDEKGLVYVTARDDDIINVAGHRLSTLAIENIVLSHPDVCDACVVSVPDPIKSEIPFCLFVMKDDSVFDEKTVEKQLVDMVYENMGPVASFKLAAAIRALPQTRSGKICRQSISSMARNKFHIPSTVLDPSVYKDIEKIFMSYGFYKQIDDDSLKKTLNS